MRLSASRPAVALAATAAFAMMASPVLARGWGDGHHHRRHGDGIDGGDVLAGLLILGGIAAIAGAASKSSDDQRDEPYRYPGPEAEPAPDDGAYGEAPPDDRPAYPPSDSWRDAGSLDGAVDRCVDEVERGERRVDTVDSVNREDGGYRVEGHMRDGRGFSCRVDRDGQIRQVAVDGHAII
ncbi:hypothetical protein [Novosphingobium album (ex Liu et al. 2023)]|uniref:PepSY domain-containing protein n=1 Tax=Novosphingobium album (ex Liu et al. 2023) TaxID=3031130 RepID=A0ABT5WQX2_9SPHN|nr:hypothetical protein [Novosphingobium album (ex Liu et al. 2023)]MDE8651388.1 hypothetical protein [Novosphingobium album (ex Liu et al. 2023)]